jgi:hypothetical protein
MMKCSTQWDAAGKVLDGFTISGNCSSSWWHDEGVPQVATCEIAAAGLGGTLTAAAVEVGDERDQAALATAV